MMALYHKDIFLPASLREAVPNKAMRVVYSQHAIAQADVKYGIDRDLLPSVLNPAQSTLVEVEVDGQGKPFKFVIRTYLDKSHDLCMPVLVKGNSLFVKTVWLNDRNDRHSTLKTHLYAKSY